MWADLTTEPVVVVAQTETAFDPVPRGKIIPSDQVMGLQVAPPAAVGTIPLLANHLTPALIGFLSPVAAARIISSGENHLTCR